MKLSIGNVSLSINRLATDAMKLKTLDTRRGSVWFRMRRIGNLAFVAAQS
jgi:hypothetical protein